MASGTNTTKQFLNSIREAVISDMQKSNILASLTASQAVLESSNGNSKLTKEANNLFGIKGNYNGNYVTMLTTEWSKEKGYYKVYAKFKKYPFISASINDHSDFLKRYPRYAKIVGCTDWREACKLMGQSGYATDPNYESKLVNIITNNKLYEWDKGEVRKGGNPYKMPNAYIQFGSKNEYVKWVQYQLNLAGYSIVIDGIAGMLTIGAVMDFQVENGLTADGIVGPTTLSALAGLGVTDGE